MEFETAGRQAQIDRQKDDMREELSKIETAVLKAFLEIETAPNFSPRWLAIARTHIEEGFMAAKRSLYSGKRVGDP